MNFTKITEYPKNGKYVHDIFKVDFDEIAGCIDNNHGQGMFFISKDDLFHGDVFMIDNQYPKYFLKVVNPNSWIVGDDYFETTKEVYIEYLTRKRNYWYEYYDKLIREEEEG